MVVASLLGFGLMWGVRSLQHFNGAGGVDAVHFSGRLVCLAGSEHTAASARVPAVLPVLSCWQG